MAQITAGDLAEKEELQKRHYSLLNNLQSMARDIPSQYQQRISYDLLSGLSSALLDGTVYEIVVSLKEVQHLEERNLYNQRAKLINDFKTQKADMTRKHRDKILDCQAKPHNLQLVVTSAEKEMEEFKSKHDEELKRKEMKLILELDQKMMDQQVILEKAGVPGFYVTNNPQEVKLQMYLLDFITKVGSFNPGNT